MDAQIAPWLCDKKYLMEISFLDKPLISLNYGHTIYPFLGGRRIKTFVHLRHDHYK
jgi:hypothetical protein